MGASCRDRTGEWSALVKSLQRSHVKLAEAEAGAAAAPRESQEHGFSKDASRVGLALQEAANKVARLSKLAKGSSMFDDPARRIQELTAILTQDITGLNTAIQELESLHILRNRDTTATSHHIEHRKMILTDLKGRLMQTTNGFKEVLTARTENLKLHESRKHLFMATASGFEGGVKPKNAVLASSSVQTPFSHTPPPWAKSSLLDQPSHSSTAAVHDATGNAQLRRRIGVGSLSSMQLQQEEYMPTQDRSRSFSALHAVESTITELSGMFSQVAVMVSQQGELAIRIDDNMDETLTSVEGAQGALLKHLHTVSSNRGLILKILLVLIIFLVVFIVILA